MFSVFFSLFVFMALLNMCAEMVMRVRLNKREPWRNKLPWWRRGGDEVAAAYQELFPGAWLPLFREFAYWFLLACAFVILVSALWKSH
jgi:hypothetical protein